MKNIRSLVNGLIVCGIALAMVSSSAAQNAAQGKAKVVRIKGSARYTTGNNVWQPLKVGDVIRAGTTVQTGLEKDGYVDLVLGDGNAPIASTTTAGSPGSPVVATPAVYYQPKAEQNFVRVWGNSLLAIDKLTTM